MGRVAAALVLYELQERARDRWVVVVTGLFALLAVGIAAYGSAAEDTAAVVTAPSLVTLAAFLVPLVALILGHDAIVGERERHTLGLLLSLPVHRGETRPGNRAGGSRTACSLGRRAIAIRRLARGLSLSVRRQWQPEIGPTQATGRRARGGDDRRQSLQAT